LSLLGRLPGGSFGYRKRWASWGKRLGLGAYLRSGLVWGEVRVRLEISAVMIAVVDVIETIG